MNPSIEATKAEVRVRLPRFENVLLCTDFSHASKLAAHVALRLCRRNNAHLTIMHVSEYGPMPAITEEGLNYVLGLAEKEQQGLKRVTEELLQKGVRAESVMEEGNAGPLILDRIARFGVDLAIVGTTAARGLDRLVFGSTAESIFRRASCPVITVGPKLEPTTIEAEGRPIVFATDFDDSSLDAFRYAASLAEITGSPLHVIHVLPLTVKRDANVVPAVVGEALRLVSMRVPPERPLPHCEVLHGSDVSHAVVEYATAKNAGFIVLGIRRRSVMSAHLPPHRTFRIIMTAPCSVLTVAYDLQSASAVAASCY